MSQFAEAFIQAGIVGNHGAAIAHCAEIFCRIETEGSQVTQRTDRLAVIAGSVRLAAIFDDPQVVPLRNLQDRLKVSRAPVEMHRKDSTSARTDDRLNLLRIDGEGSWIDIHQDRTRTAEFDRGDAGYGSMRDGDYLIAGANFTGA